MAYSGSPVLLEDLLYRPKHSLIDQSLHSKLGAETTNGDGFGVGWYGLGDEPAVFHSIEPAWNDRNLRELSRQITSRLVFAHVRASSGGAIQQTNCHPFRHENWLWMHNGLIHGLRRAQARPGAADRSEPLPAHRGIDRLRGLLLPRADAWPTRRPTRCRGTCRRADRSGRDANTTSRTPCRCRWRRLTGTTIWAFRYSSDGKARSLFYSTDKAHAATHVPRQRDASADSPRSHGWWCPSRSTTCLELGTRCRSIVRRRASGHRRVHTLRTHRDLTRETQIRRSPGTCRRRWHCV